MMQNYFAIGGLLAGFGILMAWMFITSRVPVFIRIGASAVAVIFAVSIWLNSTALMGFPVHGFPREGDAVAFSLIDRDHEAIYLWIEENEAPRIYMLPWDSDTARALLKAQQKALDENGRMVFRLRPNDGAGGRFGSSLHSESAPIEIDVVPVLPPKD